MLLSGRLLHPSRNVVDGIRRRPALPRYFIFVHITAKSTKMNGTSLPHSGLIELNYLLTLFLLLNQYLN